MGNHRIENAYQIKITETEQGMNAPHYKQQQVE